MNEPTFLGLLRELVKSDFISTYHLFKKDTIRDIIEHAEEIILLDKDNDTALVQEYYQHLEELKKYIEVA